MVAFKPRLSLLTLTKVSSQCERGNQSAKGPAVNGSNGAVDSVNGTLLSETKRPLPTAAGV